MMPSSIVPLDSLPRAPNGKIDRKALAGLRGECPPPETHAKPVTPEEKTLAGIWSQVLGLNEVSVDRSIFEMGADSLLIFRITMLSKQAGFRFTPREVYRYRTIAALSRLGDQDVSDATTQVPLVARISRDARRAGRVVA
jgi:hypothetical protein